MNLAMSWGDPSAKYALAATSKPTVGTLDHEGFCRAVRTVAVGRAIVTAEQRDAMMDAKLVYGVGTGSYRGVCHYKAWNGSAAMIEIAATGEEHAVQLAGTTIHETAHVLAGWEAGHGPEWKIACRTLGLLDAKAAGQVYTPEGFESSLWECIAALGEPNDGKPSFLGRGGNGPVPVAVAPRPCPMGRGTRGGKSFGKGSGSRLRLWECGCGVKVRVASDSFAAHCDNCGKPFEYKGK